MALTLDRIVPWGRLYEEYERMFALTADDLARPILDCGGGPASFVADATSRGIHAATRFTHSRPRRSANVLKRSPDR